MTQANKIYTIAKRIALICLLLFSAHLNAQKKVDSLLKALSLCKSDTSRAILLYQLSNDLHEDSEIIAYAEKALLVAEKLCQSTIESEVKVGKKTKANALHNMGFVYLNQGDVDKSLKYLQNSLTIWEEIGDKWGIAMTLNNLGYIYHNQGQIDKALDCYFKSLKLRESILDYEGSAYNLNNIGFIYYSLNQPLKTLEYYKKAFKIREKTKDKKGMGQSLHNLGFVYQEMGFLSPNKDTLKKQLHLALSYYEASLKLRQEVNDKQGLGLSLNAIAFIIKTKADMSVNKDSAVALGNRAIEYYLKALKVREEIQDKKGIANTMSSIGIIYLNKGNTKLAEEYCSKAFNTAKEIGFPSSIKETARSLFQVYQKTEKYKQALEMHILFKKMSDSLVSKETSQSLNKKQAQYEFEKKEELARVEQEKKDAIAEKEKQSQATVKNGLLIGFAVTFVLLIFILRGYLNKQKANKLITKQKEEAEAAKRTIENQNTLLESKQKEILDSIRYAKRIQQALLTSQTYIERMLKKLMQN